MTASQIKEIVITSIEVYMRKSLSQHCRLGFGIELELGHNLTLTLIHHSAHIHIYICHTHMDLYDA